MGLLPEKLRSEDLLSMRGTHPHLQDYFLLFTPLAVCPPASWRQGSTSPQSPRRLDSGAVLFTFRAKREKDPPQPPSSGLTFPTGRTNFPIRSVRGWPPALARC